MKVILLLFFGSSRFWEGARDKGLHFFGKRGFHDKGFTVWKKVGFILLEKGFTKRGSCSLATGLIIRKPSRLFSKRHKVDREAVNSQTKFSEKQDRHLARLGSIHMLRRRQMAWAENAPNNWRVSSASSETVDSLRSRCSVTHLSPQGNSGATVSRPQTSVA